MPFFVEVVRVLDEDGIVGADIQARYVLDTEVVEQEPER